MRKASEFEVNDMSMLRRAQFEQDFPILLQQCGNQPIAYLDNAATSLTPKPVIEAINDYYLNISANIHRGKHYLSEKASNLYEESRYRVAQFAGCSGNEVVFVRNTTEALNMVSYGLDLQEEDLVVAFTDSHHSNFLPWKSKCITKVVRVNRLGGVDLDHYEQLLKEHPKVVALTHCSNVSGLYIPIEKMIQKAKMAGALVVVDAAQSVAHRPVKMQALGADFLAFSGHKMLGPTGIGVLCARQSLLNQMNPLLLGGGMVDWVETESYTLRKIPHRFEAGTPNIAGAIGLAQAIDYIESIRFDQIKNHDIQMGRYMLQLAKERPYLNVVAPLAEEERGGIISFYIKNIKDLGDIAKILSDSFGVLCRTGHMCAQPYVDLGGQGQVLRASAYIYNTQDDILRLFQALDQVIDIIGE